MSVNTYIDGQLKPVGAVMNYDAVQTIQVSELPEPGSSCLGRIYQYTGATTEDYIHAFFYECIYDETASIYKWQIVDVNDISDISNSDITTMWVEGAVTPSDVDVIPLEADENGTYTAPEGTAYSPVTVNVPVPEIITRADWEALPYAEKKAKGEIIILDSNIGFQRGIYANGAEYLGFPHIVSAQTKNYANNSQVVSYTVETAGTYQVLVTSTNGDSIRPQNHIDITVNGVGQNAQFSRPTTNNNINCDMYVKEVNVEIGDVISIAFADSVRYSNAGIQFFVLENADINVISLFNSAGNNGSTFDITLTTWYLQFAKSGYYSGAANMQYYELDNKQKTSEPTPSQNIYWYGSTAVFKIQ